MASMIGGSTAERELAALSPWTNPAPVIGADERMQRLDRARTLMAGIGADMLLIGAGASLRYFTGVAWGATERLVAMLLPVQGDPIFICPAFELGSFDASLGITATDIRLWEEDESPSALVADALKAAGASTLAIDSMNFAVEPSSPQAIVPKLAILTLVNRGPFAVLIARFPRAELRADNRLADAEKFL